MTRFDVRQTAASAATYVCAMSQVSERAAMCRAHAEQCRAQADLAIRETASEEYLKLARQWDLLATEIEAIEKMRVFAASAGKA